MKNNTHIPSHPQQLWSLCRCCSVRCFIMYDRKHRFFLSVCVTALWILFSFSLFIPLAIDESLHNTSLYFLLLLLRLLSKYRNDQELATVWSRPTEAHWFPTKGLCVSHSIPAWKESFVPSAGSVLRCWSLPYFWKTVAVYQTVWHFPFSCIFCSVLWYLLLLIHQSHEHETGLEQPRRHGELCWAQVIWRWTVKEEESGVLVTMPEMVVMDLVFGAGGMGFVMLVEYFPGRLPWLFRYF